MPKIVMTERLKSFLVILAAIVIIVIVKGILPAFGIDAGFGMKP